MTDASPRRFGIAVIVIAVHVTLLTLLLRSVVPAAQPPTSAIELANIAAPPPTPPPPPTAVPATPAKAAVPAPLPAALPPIAIPVADAAPSAPTVDGATGSAAVGGGTGNGSGGGIVRARWASGSISNGDYPKAARAAGVGGAVTVHFDVRADGGVEHCHVVSSSGSAILDETTCRLIEARFRYVPARDAAGAAITDIAGWRQDWWLGAPKQ
ncbi:TonB family protein [Polymorphobacter arshaanensis]|uniref:Protein TonB n=1 Tax=Glacieibacterium arshaanense TaxID=2511025 RepID=A0A4Y9EJX2_9SPHN|nr:TonB family protein [Polymorphobacter arshaanensis]TFU00293.1 TonB family protein [Polymorphobacter arshaanensis]